MPVTHKGVLINMGIPAVFAEGVSSNVLSMPQMVNHEYNFDLGSDNMRVYTRRSSEDTDRKHPVELYAVLSPAVARNSCNMVQEDRKFLHSGRLYAKRMG